MTVDFDTFSGQGADRSRAPPADLGAVAQLLDAIADPAIVIDPDYRILAANPAYRAIYGTQPAARRCHEVSHRSPVPCDQAGESCPLLLCAASGNVERVLHVHHTPRGEEHVDVETRPILGADGTPRWFVEVLRPARSPGSAAAAGEGTVGTSPAFRATLDLVARVAPSETPVLLLGESGTGKELLARAVHRGSPRRRAPFVPVECSGLTETLFESELFGHEKGAFTGAHSQRVGLVESASGGTLFLDEIGDVPPALQVKLLRLLETGTYRRVGSSETLRADFRLVCATHRDLRAMLAEGTFRTDLYYRIATFPIPIPPLRERTGDLEPLTAALLERVAPERRLRLAPAALALLAAHPFPGNVRELRNALERAALLCDGDTVEARHLPPEIVDPAGGMADAPDMRATQAIVPLAEAERRYLRRALALHDGDRRALARRLQVSERTLYRKLEGL